MTMRVEAFIIHLARAEKRRPQVEKLRRDLPVPAHVIDAVDGNALSAAEIEQVYQRHLFKPRYPFALRPGEIGCFLSHRRAWQAIVDRGLDAGLIVEDDVEVDVGTLERLFGLHRGVFAARDYLRFPHKANEAGQIVAESEDATLFKPAVPGLGMVMQLVGREAASALLAQTERFDRPVDTAIQLGCNGIRLLSSRPLCVREISAQMGGTVIQGKQKSLGESVTREVKRAIYRARMRRAVKGAR